MQEIWNNRTSAFFCRTACIFPLQLLSQWTMLGAKVYPSHIREEKQQAQHNAASINSDLGVPQFLQILCN